MAEEIRILSRKAFRFVKPGSTGVSKPKPNETPEEAVNRVAHDSAKLLNNAARQHHIQDGTFTTQPGHIQDAPAWIKQDEMFEWAVKDGDIEELVRRPTSAPKAKAPEAGNARMGGAIPEVSASPNDLVETADDEPEPVDEEEEEETEEEELPEGADQQEGEAPIGALSRRRVAGPGSKKKGKKS